MEIDPRVPGFLGRVLNQTHDSLGTCFQIEPGVLVTAWHVLNDLGVGSVGAVVQVDPLQRGSVRDTEVKAVDEIHDLAVLVTADPLPDSVAGLDASDEVSLQTAVTITGVAELHDPGRAYRHLDASGQWDGGTARDDQVRLGRLTADAVVPGMSGAPVLLLPHRRRVVGIVSARYNSVDGWAEHSVWVARTEDLAPLLEGIIDATVTRRAHAGHSDAVTILAGDTHAPFHSEIKSFLSAQLHTADGELPFAGRDGEVRLLTEWLDDPDAPGYQLLSGPAGIGKSTLVVRWAAAIAQRPNVRVIVVPVSLRFGTAQERDVLDALVSRLAYVHGTGHYRLMTLAEARERTRTLLIWAAPPGQHVVVVLDALDEASGWDPGPNLLPKEIGRGVRVLLTARHTVTRPNGADWATHLTLQAATVVHTLDPLGPAVMSELLHQIRPGDNPADLTEAAQLLWTLTSGNPVTVGLYLADIRALPADGLGGWVTARHDSPTGLAGFYQTWWTEQQQLWSGQASEDAELVLRVFATAEAPLRRSDLRTVVNKHTAALHAGRLARAVHMLARLVVFTGPDRDSLVLIHPAIADMLREELRPYGGDDEVHQAFANWGADVLAGLGTREIKSAEVPDYLGRYLAVHLTSGERFRPDAMRLISLTWRIAKDAVSDDAAGYAADVRRVADHARRLDQQRTDRGQPPALLPERALCAAELAGESSVQRRATSANIAVQFVRHGLWRPTRALSYVAAHSNVLSEKALGLAAVASVTPVEQIPALDRLIGSTLEGPYPEVTTLLVAWARRLLELGRTDEAVAAAFRFRVIEPSYTGGASQRLGRAFRVPEPSYTPLRVLAELIPRLPEEHAAPTLHRAITEVMRGAKTSAVCKLTQEVTRELAERLWARVADNPFPDDVLAVVEHAARYGKTSPVAFVIAAFDKRDHYESPPPFHPWGDTGAVAVLDDREFVAVARWLDKQALRSRFQQTIRADGTKSSWSPTTLDDGLMSIAPRPDAAEAAVRVMQGLDGQDRLCCLAQLLPLLDGQLRQTVEEELFESPERLLELDSDARWVVPQLVAAGMTNRIVATLREAISTNVGEPRWLVVRLAPYLSAAHIEALLAVCSAEDDWPRHALLAQKASLGVEQAILVLEGTYASGPDRDLSRRAVSLVREEDEQDQSGNQGSPFSDMSWEDRYAAHTGSKEWEAKTPWTFFPPPRRLGEENLLRALDEAEWSTDELFSLALDLSGGITERLVPRLITRARNAEPWKALTLLAAGTHLRPSPVRNQLLDELRTTLNRIRENGLVPSSGAPWLTQNFNYLAPFFARLVTRDLRREVGEVLFDGGYFDKVLESDYSDKYGNKHWPYEAAWLTPLLDAEQLSGLERAVAARSQQWLDGRGGNMQVTAAFAGNIAIGYAALGQLDDSARILTEILDGEKAALRRGVLDEIMYLLPTDRIGWWITLVHRSLLTDSDSDRWMLWRKVIPRLAYLPDQQARQILDMWLHEVPANRTQFIRDLRFYRHLVIRIAGKQEYLRMLDLLEHAY